MLAFAMDTILSVCVCVCVCVPLSVSPAAAARIAGSERTITVRTDTTSAAVAVVAAAVAPSTGRGTTTRSTTGTVRCSPPGLAPARLQALSAVASTRRSRTSSLGSATPSPARLGATRTETTEAAAPTGPTTIDGAGPHTLLSRGTRRLRGARERPLKPPTRPRERLYRPAGARGHARLPAPTPSAALAAAAAAGIVPSFLTRFNLH